MLKLEESLSRLINKDPTVVNENANKDSETFTTMRDLTAGVVSKSYALEHLLPKHVAAAHLNGDIHFHDLDYHPFQPLTNCCLIDIKGMLEKGFEIGNAQVESPKSIQTATAQIVQIIANVSSSQYGGCTVDRIDEVLSQYAECNARKHREIGEKFVYPEQLDDYVRTQTEKDIKDAMQSLEYEINTLYTSNGQTPFVTLGFGLGTDTYSRMIQKAILKTRIQGLGHHHVTAIFPKLVYSIKKGVNFAPEDINYDVKQLALECSTKRMYPDILNYDQVVKVTGSFKAPMGCRSFLGAYEENGHEVHDGRNNLGVVSLNLPRIALEAQGNEEKFYHTLDERLALAKKALLTRIARLENTKARVAPILYMEGACGVRLKADDKVADIFKNGRASISLGYIGIHETINALYKQGHIFDNEQLREKGIAIVRRLSEAVKQWQKETGYAFSLYSTPSENLCDRFCRLDTKQFGVIEGVTDKGYYTNSYHLDVEKKVNPYDKLDFEMPYPELASGGFICYGEYPNIQHNLKALEDVWDYSYD
ncbi:MAG: anaerobic ribonucleoside-triphosphate reductase, partial [Staphylococcus simulans]|nr:anaerobic ribonucleoside-triphosphate reductase [Staphylococcus simulans]